jgi:hypothetical protein
MAAAAASPIRQAGPRTRELSEDEAEVLPITASRYRSHRHTFRVLATGSSGRTGLERRMVRLPAGPFFGPEIKDVELTGIDLCD